jgi:low affinity Fe/Cu permease
LADGNDVPHPVGVSGTHLRWQTGMAKLFANLSNRIARWTGHYVAFVIAITIIIVWGVTGPLFKFSDTWQLVINTGTTIVTFLMVFLIQNTQNRDSMAVHLKLDELIHAIDAADNALIDAEDETEKELEDLKRRYLALCDEHDALKAHVSKTLQHTSSSPSTKHT